MKEESLWDHKLLAYSHLLLAAAILSWFLPGTSSLWHWADHNIFYLLNGTLSNEADGWTTFWAYANHRVERKICPAVMALISVIWMIGGKKENFFYRSGLMIFFWAFMEISIPLMNAFVMKFLEIRRASPSNVLEPVVRLSQVVSFGPIRDASAISFPSGHSFVMGFWAIFMTFCSRRFGAVAITLATLNSFPRLFAGGHWLSDCLFAVMIAFVIFSWGAGTPLHHKCASFCARTLEKIFAPVRRLRAA